MSFVTRTMVVRLRWRDNDGAESDSLVNLPGATSIDSALSFLASWRALAMNISSAVCYAADLIIRYAENYDGGAALASDAFRFGVFIFGSDPDALATVRIPSFRTVFLETSGPYAGIAIDQTEPEVAALVVGLVVGLGGVAACDPLALDLGELATAYIQQQ